MYPELCKYVGKPTIPTNYNNLLKISKLCYNNNYQKISATYNSKGLFLFNIICPPSIGCGFGSCHHHFRAWADRAAFPQYLSTHYNRAERYKPVPELLSQRDVFLPIFPHSEQVSRSQSPTGHYLLT